MPNGDIIYRSLDGFIQIAFTMPFTVNRLLARVRDLCVISAGHISSVPDSQDVNSVTLQRCVDSVYGGLSLCESLQSTF